MKNGRNSRVRWILLILLAIFFAVLQGFVRTEGSAGGRCAQSLTASSPEDRAEIAWVTLGWPAEFATVMREGCDSPALVRVDWYWQGVLADMLTFAGFCAMVFLATGGIPRKESSVGTSASR